MTNPENLQKDENNKRIDDDIMALLRAEVENDPLMKKILAVYDIGQQCKRGEPLTPEQVRFLLDE